MKEQHQRLKDGKLTCLGKVLLELPEFLMPSHPLANFAIQKYYQNKTKFNGVYSRNNLPEIMDGAYVINLHEFKSIGTHWTALYVNDNNNRRAC